MKKTTKLNLSIPVMCIGLAILTTLLTTAITITNPFFISSTSALTYQDSVDLNFTFNPTLNLTITGGDLTIGDLAPGNYNDSNVITVTSGSNSVTGYTLYANVGSSTIDYTDLRISSNDTNATNIFTSLSSNKGTLASFDGGTWGYSYSTDSGTTWISGDFDDPNVGSHTGYNGLPLYSGNGGVKLAKTTAPSNPSTIQFKIGAKAANTQASGTYTNTVNFISVGNVITTSYSLNYTDTTSEATNMPNPTTGTTTNGIFTITDTIPSRTDYHFKGWCTVNNTTNPTTCTDGINTGSIIEPGGQYVIGDTVTNFTGTVYAVWTTGYMQNISLSTLAALMPNIGDTTTLLDSRDEQAYTIAKLADGKYWMTTNLNIAGGTALSAKDTDVSNTYINNFTTSNNLTKSGDTIVLPSSSTEGFDTNNYSYVYNSGNDTDDCTGSGCYSYYSWDAATLGSGRDISTENTDAPYSICPKGWRLPTTYNGSGTAAEAADFRALMIALGGSNSIQVYDSSTNPTGATMLSTLQSSPNNFLLPGNYTGSSFKNGADIGFYWSSTSYYTATNARLLRLLKNSDKIDSSSSAGRYAGFSVRCLYQPTMQNINKTDLVALMPNEGDSTTLRDSRDNQDYIVAKLADGKYWMTKNLAIGCSSANSGLNYGDTAIQTALNNTDSNVTNSSSSPWYTPTALLSEASSGTQTADYTNPRMQCNSTYGGYYNYAAATAGTITGDNNTAESVYDICPKNWHLPSQSDFGGITSQVTAFSAVYSGYYYYGYHGDVDSRGYWWSSTASNTTGHYNLHYYNGNLNINYIDRYRGLSIRCIGSF